MPWLILGFIVLVAAGCAAYKPLTGVSDFWTDDPILYQAFMRAADIWTQAGVAAASIVTIELISKDKSDAWKKKGRKPVIRKERNKLYTYCIPSDPSYRGDGCGGIRNGTWTGIYIPYDLINPGRLNQVMLHELGHILAETREHTPDDCIAVMHPNGTSTMPTDDDIAYMQAHTTVLDPQDLA